MEVYWNVDCTQIVDVIDWSVPSLGDTMNHSIFVKNSGNAPMNLSLTTLDWVPVAGRALPH